MLGPRERLPAEFLPRDRLREEFQRLRAHLRLVPAGHWHRVDDDDFLLTAVQRAVRVPLGDTRRERHGFARLAEGDARSLERLLAVERPTAGDLAELSRLWEGLLERGPPAGPAYLAEARRPCRRWPNGLRRARASARPGQSNPRRSAAGSVVPDCGPAPRSPRAAGTAAPQPGSGL